MERAQLALLRASMSGGTLLIIAAAVGGVYALGMFVAPHFFTFSLASMVDPKTGMPYLAMGGMVMMGSGMGSSGAKEAGYLILSAIAMLVGLSLIPTIAGSVAPVYIANQNQLEGTVVQFIPVGLALALLVIAFSIAVMIVMKSTQSMGSKPVAIIIAVIVLVIGIGLILPIDNAKDDAIQAVCGTTGATYADGADHCAWGSAWGKTTQASFGSYKAAATSADATPDGNSLALRSAFSLAKTVLDYTVIGFILSLLVASFGMANLGTGGAATRYASRRFGGR